jgi:hypothetical protein
MPGSSGTPSISNSVFARTVSQASHVSPSLGPLPTVLMPSRGRRGSELAQNETTEGFLVHRAV